MDKNSLMDQLDRVGVDAAPGPVLVRISVFGQPVWLDVTGVVLSHPDDPSSVHHAVILTTSPQPRAAVHGVGPCSLPQTVLGPPAGEFEGPAISGSGSDAPHIVSDPPFRFAEEMRPDPRPFPLASLPAAAPAATDDHADDHAFAGSEEIVLWADPSGSDEADPSGIGWWPPPRSVQERAESPAESHYEGVEQ